MSDVFINELNQSSKNCNLFSTLVFYLSQNTEWKQLPAPKQVLLVEIFFSSLLGIYSRTEVKDTTENCRTEMAVGGLRSNAEGRERRDGHQRSLNYGDRERQNAV